MMIQPPINKLIEKAGNRYTLVIEASKRARQISEGDTPLVNIGSKKPVTIAVNEIVQDKIIYVET